MNITNEKLVLYVHYEPNPYITRYKLKNVANSRNVDEFEKRRNLVLKVVHDEIDKLGDPHIKKYEGTNSIAYTEFYFKKDTTIGDFKEIFVKYVYMLSNIIDKSLDIVDKNGQI